MGSVERDSYNVPVFSIHAAFDGDNPMTSYRTDQWREWLPRLAQAGLAGDRQRLERLLTTMIRSLSPDHLISAKSWALCSLSIRRIPTGSDGWRAVRHPRIRKRDLPSSRFSPLTMRPCPFFLGSNGPGQSVPPRAQRVRPPVFGRLRSTFLHTPHRAPWHRQVHVGHVARSSVGTASFGAGSGFLNFKLLRQDRTESSPHLRLRQKPAMRHAVG